MVKTTPQNVMEKSVQGKDDSSRSQTLWDDREGNEDDLLGVP